MKRKAAALLALVLAAAMLAAGCRGGFLQGEAAPENREPTGELQVVFPPYYNATAIRVILEQYEELYPEVEVTCESYGVSETQEYLDRMQVLSQSDMGADVVFFPRGWRGMGRLMRKDTFLDLTPFLQQDRQFKEADYIDHVFEAGQMDGKQYLVPYRVLAPLMLSSTDRLAGIGISEVADENIASFLRQIAEKTPEAMEKEGFRQMMDFKRFFYFYPIVQPQLMDYSANQVLPQPELIREFFESYKLYYPYDYEDITSSAVTDYCSRQLLGGEFYFNGEILGIPSLVVDASVLKNNGGYTISLLRDMEGKASVIYMDVMAVLAGAENPYNAYRMVRLMLSQEMQKIFKGSSLISVRKDIVSSQAKSEQRTCYSGYDPFEDPRYITRQLTDEEIQEMVDLVCRPDGSICLDGSSWGAAWDAMEPYLRDEKSYEDCYQELYDQLTLFLEEP